MSGRKTSYRLAIFLASPSDVQEERQAARDGVDGFNRSIGREIGWFVDLLGWEDMGPGVGRPQEIINEEVDACDVFLGVLHMRWGSPTGEFSSGFEEEFERARNRRLDTREPDTWLFFKEIENKFLSDPGEQLKKVLAFREREQSRREVLFKDFASPQDFSRQLSEHLAAYVTRRHVRLQEQTNVPSRAPGDDEQPLPPKSPTTVPAKPDGIRDAGQSEVSLLFKKASEFVLDPDQSVGAVFQELELARLYLATASWLSTSQTRDPLSVHSVNMLYKYRSQLVLSKVEARTLFSSVVGSTADNTPGWYWMRRLKQSGQTRLVAVVGLSPTTDEGSRLAALALLTSSAAHLPEDMDRSSYFEALLSDSSDAIRLAALAYLGATGSQEDLDDLAGILLTDDVPDYPALLAKMNILAREDPAEAFRLLVEESVFLVEEELHSLQSAKYQIPAELARQGLESPDARVRQLALDRLDRSGRMTKSIALSMLSDSSFSIRRRAIESVLRNNWKVPRSTLFDALKPLENEKVDHDEVSATKRQIFEHATLDELESLIGWYKGLDSVLAYEVLTLNHFARVGDSVRAELQSGFTGLRTAGRENLRTELGDEFTQALISKWEGLDNWLQDLHTAAALKALARHGVDTDLAIVKPFLESQSHLIRRAAIGAVGALGSAEDASDLLKLTDDFELGRHAAAAAIGLAPAPKGWCVL